MQRVLAERTGLGEMVKGDLLARGKAAETAAEWGSRVDRFVACCGEKSVYDRADVVKFVGSLRLRGLRQNSINQYLKTIRLLAGIQGWELPKLSMPKVKAEDIRRPIFEGAVVRGIIEAAKRECDGRELAYLCLSTVYGLRREELTSCEIGDKLVVHTLKGGNVTEHVIPEGLRVWLKGYGRVGVERMGEVFQQICRKCGNGHESGFGWHSMRRALATELVLGEVSALNILRFMRWSDRQMRGELGMLTIYARKDQLKVDAEIFKVHPFLGSWGTSVNVHGFSSNVVELLREHTSKEINMAQKVEKKVEEKVQQKRGRWEVMTFEKAKDTLVEAKEAWQKANTRLECEEVLRKYGGLVGYKPVVRYCVIGIGIEDCCRAYQK